MGNSPWCMAGDYNSKLTMDDRKGRAHSGNTPCVDFVRLFQKSEMLDIGFQGSSFTWAWRSLLERIDRVFVNQALVDVFPQCTILHLPKIYLDHCPLLIKN